MTGAPPLVTPAARLWWEALARHEIAMPRCEGCAAWIFYPRPFCPACGGVALRWHTVPGVATLHTFSIARVPVAPMFAHLHEPVLAVAELGNGVRIPTTLVDVGTAEIRIGMTLAPMFDDAAYAGVTLLRFRPDG